MAVVIVEACNLQLPAVVDLSFRRNLFVQTVLQNGMALPPKQRGEAIQLIENRRQRSARLSIIRFEWTRSIRHGSENNIGVPIIGEANIQICAWTERGSRSSQPHQNIFAAILQNGAISERHGAALIKAHTPKSTSHGSQLGFAQDQRRVRAGTEGSGWEPHGGDAAGWGITVVVHLACQDHSVRAPQLLVVGHGGSG